MSSNPYKTRIASLFASCIVGLACLSGSALAQERVIDPHAQTDVGEGSGLIASRQYPHLYWFIRDGGPETVDKPRSAVYSMHMDGRTQPDVAPTLVEGMRNTNWEDLAIDDEGNLWIGDIGANKCGRRDQTLIKIGEPQPGDASIGVKQRYVFRFPDPPAGCATWNSEAMFWLDGHLYLIAKNAESGIYRVDLRQDGTASLVKIARLQGVSNQSVASINSKRTRLMVAGHQGMSVYTASQSGLSGDAFIRDIASRRPAYKASFSCDGCNANNKASVEGGSFMNGRDGVVFIAENKRVYLAWSKDYSE